MSNEPLYAQEDRKTHLGSLSPAQVEFYRVEGYVVIDSLLSQADLLPARTALEAKVEMIAQEMFAAGKISHLFENEAFEYRLAKMFEGHSDEDFLAYGRSWRDRHPGYFEFMSNPKIIDTVESLIGSELFANPVYNARPKVPKVAAGAVPWHQDRSYWPGANANPVITVWIPLVDADEINGCLKIWPRTHNTELIEHHADQYSGTGYREIDTDDAALREFKKIKEVTIPLKAGGAILFNDRCVHMSTPNNSDHVRWSVDLRYQPTGQDPMESHGAGFLCRSAEHPERVATMEDWIENRLEAPVSTS
jgi:phytanoyl-CoA hydroxylase